MVLLSLPGAIQLKNSVFKHGLIMLCDYFCTCCSFKIGLLVDVLPHYRDITTLIFFSSRLVLLVSLLGL